MSLTGGVIIPRDLAQMPLLRSVLVSRVSCFQAGYSPLSVNGHLEIRNRGDVGSRKENTNEFGHLGNLKTRDYNRHNGEKGSTNSYN